MRQPAAIWTCFVALSVVAFATLQCAPERALAASNDPATDLVRMWLTIDCSTDGEHSDVLKSMQRDPGTIAAVAPLLAATLEHGPPRDLVEQFAAARREQLGEVRSELQRPLPDWFEAAQLPAVNSTIEDEQLESEEFDESCRWRAAAALVALGDASGLEKLRAIAADPKAKGQAAAQHALQKR